MTKAGTGELPSAIALISDSDDWNFSDAPQEEADDAEANFFSERLIAFGSRDAPQGLWEVWRALTLWDERFYFPQVGDAVTIIWPAYAATREAERLPPPQEGGPDLSNGIISQIALENECLRLTIRSGDHKVFNVLFRIPQTVEWLILTKRIEPAARAAKLIQPGDALTVLKLNDNWTVQRLTYCAVAVQKAKGFRGIRATNTEGSEVLLSAWNIGAINDLIVFTPDPSLEFPKRPSEFVKGLTAGLTNPLYKEWVHFFGLDNPEFVSKLDFPMSLSMIGEKFENGYYRSVDAIEQDLEALFRNIVAYHPDNFEIHESARELRDNLTRAMRNSIPKKK
jgi:hypothetical protein